MNPSRFISRPALVGDAWGGLAAMLVALPAAIAYGVAAYAPLGPEFVGTGVRAALLGAAIVGIVPALVGGAAQLISAPSAPAAAVLASVGSALIAGGQGRHAFVLLIVITSSAGLLQALYGVVGIGRLIKFIPYPVVTGYLSAVALMILLSQVPRVLGAPADSSFLEAVLAPQRWQWPAITVAAATIAGMLSARRVTARIPPAILALGTGIAAYLLLALLRPGLLHLEGNILLLGPVAPASLSGTGAWESAARLAADDLRLIAGPAVTLSILLSIDTLKTCVVVDALGASRHDTNRTLLGQGVANFCSGLVGGMPGSGVVGATLVNVESGGRHRTSGVLEGCFVLVAVIAFSRWFAWLPLAALAGILVVVAVRMIDWRSLHLLRQRSTVLDFAVAATVVVVAIASNLIAAAAAGVGLAMVLFIRDHARTPVVRRKTRGNRISSKQHRAAAEQAVLDQHGGEIMVCELQGSLFFGTTDQLLHELEPDLPACRYLVLDLRRVQSVDSTATHLFRQIDARLAAGGGRLALSRVPSRRDLRDYLAAQATSGGGARTFATLDDALQWAEDQVIAGHVCLTGGDAAPMALQGFELLRAFEPDPELSVFRTCVSERSLAAGESLFHAGDHSNDLYLVRRGIVRVTLPLNGNGYHTLSTFGRGAFFGEIAFLVRGRRSADAAATTNAELFVVSRAQLDRISRAHPEIAVELFARLARTLAVRLRKTDAELRALYEA